MTEGLAVMVVCLAFITAVAFVNTIWLYDDGERVPGSWMLLITALAVTALIAGGFTLDHALDLPPLPAEKP